MHTCLGENGSAIDIRTPRMRRCILFRHRPVRTFEGERPRTAPWRRRQLTTLEERYCSLAEAFGACAHCVGSVSWRQAVRLSIRAVSEVRPV